MIVKLLTEHHLEFLSFKGGCRGSSKSTHVKIPNCWKSHAPAHIYFVFYAQGSLSSNCTSLEKHCKAGLQIFFQDRWAQVTHGAKKGGSFSEMMDPSRTK